ncbi:kelch-like protein 10 [Zootermopsis nevadensis]|uniref:kelch-like protein 10 n=1 Tax=Zootermopsis nevadensis TaxID=136037 RepID=UPI000B8EB7CB|nr:kelch-like protein 10 [Zootermopsis nevadensis]
MHKCRACLNVAVLGEMVYAMGGYVHYEGQETAERYDRKTNEWSWIAPMNSQRWNASAAVLNDKIYVAGGCATWWAILDSVEMYDPVTNQWTLVAKLRSARQGHCCVVFHGSLYVLGKNSEYPE